MFRIAIIYNKKREPDSPCITMDHIRWIRIAEGLAELGAYVDLVFHGRIDCHSKSARLRFIGSEGIAWNRYDVIKTCFHAGIKHLEELNGHTHPFIISKLGSVVGSNDQTEGVHFFNQERQLLYRLQEKICRYSRFVTVLTEQSKALWAREFGGSNEILLMPTGVDREIPATSVDPYKEYKEKIAVYIGNLYEYPDQREVNLIWQNKLNRIGSRLKNHGIRLCFVGRGSIDQLDPSVVTYLGSVPNEKLWDYQAHADVGIVLAQGEVQHNESSKIYYYLRSGLPIVSEEPVPNNHLIYESGLGLTVPFNDEQAMESAAVEVVSSDWDREKAVQYVVRYHSWAQRAEEYYRIICAQLNRSSVKP